MLEELYKEHGVWGKLEALAKTANFPASKEVAQALENMGCLTTNLVVRQRKMLEIKPSSL